MVALRRCLDERLKILRATLCRLFGLERTEDQRGTFRREKESITGISRYHGLPTG